MIKSHIEQSITMQTQHRHDRNTLLVQILKAGPANGMVEFRKSLEKNGLRFLIEILDKKKLELAKQAKNAQLPNVVDEATTEEKKNLAIAYIKSACPLINVQFMNASA
jgi:hypothetical protein